MPARRTFGARPTTRAALVLLVALVLLAGLVNRVTHDGARDGSSTPSPTVTHSLSHTPKGAATWGSRHDLGTNVGI